MRRELYKTGIVTCLFLFQLIPGIIVAQSQNKESFETLNYNTEKVDTLDYVDTEFSANLVVENGFFFGESHLGVEAIILQPGQNIFAGFFVGTVGNNSLIGSAWVGGITLCQQKYLRDGNSHLNNNVLKFYFRSGLGVGIGHHKSDLESDTELYGGLHLQGVVGSQLKVFDRFWFYTQGGGRLMWFPAVEDIGFFGTPMLAAGFRVSTDFGSFIN